MVRQIALLFMTIVVLFVLAGCGTTWVAAGDGASVLWREEPTWRTYQLIGTWLIIGLYCAFNRKGDEGCVTAIALVAALVVVGGLIGALTMNQTIVINDAGIERQYHEGLVHLFQPRTETLRWDEVRACFVTTDTRVQWSRSMATGARSSKSETEQYARVSGKTGREITFPISYETGGGPFAMIAKFTLWPVMDIDQGIGASRESVEKLVAALSQHMPAGVVCKYPGQ
ncbi:MAG: hypothetical protein M1335_04050 [Chloroflexi bacterium]|nr:hypothetical protein [Chloroflexota bacterium]